MLISGALVWLMTPGLAYYYAGMCHAKNALSVLVSTVLTISVVTMQWFCFGYSIALSDSTSPIIGDCKYCALKNSIGGPHPNAMTIPSYAYWFFQLTFAIITPALAFGAAAGRCRPGPFCVFVLLWSTVVYDFIAYWVWAPNGWLRAKGSLDFAGGTAVHISSGFAGLALSLDFERRKKERDDEEAFYPHSPAYVLLGTALLFFGWFGFNGGSEVAADERAALAIINTAIAGAFGGGAWVFADMLKMRRISILGFCSGAVAGLVAITPGSGFVPPWAAVIFGIVGGAACCYAIELKKVFRLDDACDVFGVHGVGGVIGCLLTGIFTDKNTLAVFGASVPYGGAINNEGHLLAWQIVAVLASTSWSFFITGLLIVIMHHIPFLRLRAAPHETDVGIDRAYLGDHPEAPPMIMTSASFKEWVQGRPSLSPADAEEMKPVTKVGLEAAFARKESSTILSPEKVHRVSISGPAATATVTPITDPV